MLVCLHKQQFYSCKTWTEQTQKLGGRAAKQGQILLEQDAILEQR